MKLLQKDKFLILLGKYGFTDIDEIALVKLFLTIETLVKNLLDNTVYVMESSKAKTITPKHFAIVLHIIKTHGVNVTINDLMKGGGGTYMPSEFFNPTPSGAYGTANIYSPTWVDGFTRAELAAYGPLLVSSEQSGGGKKKTTSALLDVDALKEMIVEYKKHTKKEFRVATQSYDIIISSVTENIENLLSAASKMRKTKTASKKLTKALLFATLKKHSNEFIHMCTVWN
jgi:hypothetical protein